MEEEADEFGEWDADFLDQLIQVEERALSTQFPPPPPPPPSLSQPAPPPPSHSFPQPHSLSISYSPPRELCQRNPRVFASSSVLETAVPKTSSTRWYSGGSPKNRDNQRPKREQRHLPNQLGARSQEGTPIEHKNEKGKTNEQINSVPNHAECKGFTGQSSKEVSLSHAKDMAYGGRSSGLSTAKDVESIKSSNDKANIHFNTVSPTCKAVGVQTDIVEESSLLPSKCNQHGRHKLSGKLLSIWNSSCEEKAGKSFISNLFVACHSLFMLKDGVSSSKTKRDSLEDESSANVHWPCHLHSSSAPETAKLSEFYYVLTKISNGMAQIEALFEPLINLYSIENVLIVHRSLCITKLILKNLLSSPSEAGQRGNVMIDELITGEDVAGIPGAHSAVTGLPSIKWKEPSCVNYSSKEHMLSDSGTFLGDCHAAEVSVASVDWIFLFEYMHQIIMKHNEALVRSEAVSIMNLIVLMSKVFQQRERFGTPPAFDSISKLLKKESGFAVQIQALNLLFLLLNCPNVLEKFYSSIKNGDHADSLNGSDVILDGLAQCVGRHGNTIQELKLQRNAIILLAFLASSGAAGFEILIDHKLSKGENFLMLILQALVAAIDVEVAGSSKLSETSKERNFLIREALILLNRLVSNPLYSAGSLQALTRSRDMASLTIDVANRLSCQQLWSRSRSSMNRLVLESEVVDLAKVFKRRVYTYLGDNI